METVGSKISPLVLNPGKDLYLAVTLNRIFGKNAQFNRCFFHILLFFICTHQILCTYVPEFHFYGSPRLTLQLFFRSDPPYFYAFVLSSLQ